MTSWHTLERAAPALGKRRADGPSVGKPSHGSEAEVPEGSMRVTDVISGREGVAGVQWLLQGRQPRAVLLRLLRTMLEGPGVLRGCSLTRAKYRANQKLTATFDVCLRDPQSAIERTRPVSVVWSSRDNHDSPAGDTATGLEAEALRRGASAPFRKLAAEVPAWNMRLWVAPLDERFPQLIRLSDPVYAGEALGRAPAPPQVHWIRYRPGQRHLLRYDVPTAEGVWTSFVKVYSGEAGRRAYEEKVQICDWLAVRNGGIASVRPLALLPGDMAVVFPRAPGAPFSTYLERPYRGLPRLLAQAGAALRVLQSAPVSLTGADNRWDLGKQVAGTARTAEHRLALLPSVGDSFRRLLDRAQRAEERTRREPEVFAHGDFKADHLYVTARGFTLIDFDNCCRAEPGYDAGKFLADLHWWFSAEGPARVEQAQAHFLAGYAPDAHRLLRIRLWEAVMLAHLSIRRLMPFQDDFAARLECMMAGADAVLKRVEAAANTRREG